MLQDKGHYHDIEQYAKGSNGEDINFNSNWEQIKLVTKEWSLNGLISKIIQKLINTIRVFKNVLIFNIK